MTEIAMPTSKGTQTAPTDPEQAVQEPPKDQEELLDSRVLMSQSGSSAKRATPGRMPLFGR